MSHEHNHLDYAVRLQRGMRLAAGIATDEMGVTRLGETWQPILDPYSQPEWTHLIGDRLVVAQQTQAAVAAQLAAVGVRNPTGSRMLIIADYHEFEVTADQVVSLRIRAQSATAITSTGTPFARDSRGLGGFGGGGGQGLVITASAAAATSFGNGPVWISATTNTLGKIVRVPFVLSPGFEILWYGQNANQSLTTSIAWREVRILPGQQS